MQGKPKDGFRGVSLGLLHLLDNFVKEILAFDKTRSADLLPMT